MIEAGTDTIRDALHRAIEHADPQVAQLAQTGHLDLHGVWGQVKELLTTAVEAADARVDAVEEQLVAAEELGIEEGLSEESAHHLTGLIEVVQVAVLAAQHPTAGPGELGIPGLDQRQSVDAIAARALEHIAGLSHLLGVPDLPIPAGAWRANGPTGPFGAPDAAFVAGFGGPYRPAPTGAPDDRLQRSDDAELAAELPAPAEPAEVAEAAAAPDPEPKATAKKAPKTKKAKGAK